MTDPMKREIERAIYDAEHPSGMSTHDGMARISAATLRRLYELTDKYQWQVRDTCVRAEKAEAQRDALQQTLHDELAGNLRLRDLGGARPDEPMMPFLERIIAERDALLEALEEIHQATMKNKVVIAKYIGINFLAAIAIRKAKEGE